MSFVGFVLRIRMIDLLANLMGFQYRYMACKQKKIRPICTIYKANIVIIKSKKGKFKANTNLKKNKQKQSSIVQQKTTAIATKQFQVE